MANKSFGTKQLDLTGASGSPINTSPSDLSINATTVAISTNVSVGGYFGSNVNVGAGYSIGIGTTIPVAELEVKGDIGLSGSIVATGNTFTVKTSDSERLRITPLGLVGIGTDNPSQELTIHGSTFTSLLIKSDRTSSTDQIGGVSFMNQAVGVSTATMNALVDGTMLFKTAGYERLRITGINSETKIGFGTDDPIGSFHFVGDEIVFQGNTELSNSINLTGDGGIEMFRDPAAAGGGSYIDFKDANEDYDCRIQQSEDGLILYTGGSTSSSAKLTITTSGNVVCNGSPAYFRLPHVTTSEMNSLSAVVGGEMVYNTTENGVYFYQNTVGWRVMQHSG